jgi:predicted Rossmann fold flavoprotein
MREMDSCEYRLVIDLKPALSNEQLDARLLRDFSKYINKDFINSLGDLLPRKLIPVIVEQSGIPYEFKVNQLTKEMRMKLISLIKGLTMTVKQFRPIEEAIITSGGVDVSEINPKTMESKFVEGLFFAGEVIDVDAYTGGFNLQIAFSTGYVAGFHC